MFQRQPVQKFHDDEGLTILLPDLMDGADVGVVECRCGTGFPSETFQCLRVLCNILGQEL